MMAEQKQAWSNVDLDELLKDVETIWEISDQKSKGDEYFNPWNKNMKKKSGSKRIYCDSLPDKLPEE